MAQLAAMPMPASISSMRRPARSTSTQATQVTSTCEFSSPSDKHTLTGNLSGKLGGHGTEHGREDTWVNPTERAAMLALDSPASLKIWAVSAGYRCRGRVKRHVNSAHDDVVNSTPQKGFEGGWHG